MNKIYTYTELTNLIKSRKTWDRWKLEDKPVMDLINEFALQGYKDKVIYYYLSDKDIKKIKKQIQKYTVR